MEVYQEVVAIFVALNFFLLIHLHLEEPVVSVRLVTVGLLVLQPVVPDNRICILLIDVNIYFS